jgi:LDH2 family malate/lactate/ureidoglycolate dehydrogenase
MSAGRDRSVLRLATLMMPLTGSLTRRRASKRVLRQPTITGTMPAAGHQAGLVPGSKAWRARDEREHSGVPLASGTGCCLVELGRRLGVAKWQGDWRR